MTNHCINVGCSKCGYCFCLRGCSYEGYNKPENIKEDVKVESEKCPKCKGSLYHA